MTLYAYALQPFVEYGFMRRALAACAALSVGGAPLGVFLVLRRMALIGDAMSHAILPGVSLAFPCRLSPATCTLPALDRQIAEPPLSKISSPTAEPVDAFTNETPMPRSLCTREFVRSSLAP